MIGRLIIFIFILALPSFVFGISNLEITDVQISCKGSDECEERVEKLSALKRKYSSLNHIRTLLKLYMRDPSVHFFTFEIIENEDGSLKLKGFLFLRERIEELNFDEVEKLVSIPSILPLKEDSFYDEKKLTKMLDTLRDLLIAKGYPNSNVTAKKSKTKEGYRIKIKVKQGKPRIINDINIITENKFLKSYILRETYGFIKKPMDLQAFKEVMEELRQTFLSFGYYKLDFKIVQKAASSTEINLFVEVEGDEVYAFHFIGNEFFSEADLKKKLSDAVITLNRVDDLENVKQVVKEYYQQKGFFDVKVEGTLANFNDIQGNKTNRYQLSISERDRYKIEKLIFTGNSYFSDKELMSLFYVSMNEDSVKGFHDENYYHEFGNILRNKYLGLGFVNVLIEKPKITIDKEKKTINIEYQIREVARTLVSVVNFGLNDSNLISKLKSVMINKEKKYFNPLVLDQDLKAVIGTLKSEGYYYARLKSLKANDLVRYSQDNSSVELVLEIDLDQKYTINNLIIIGNYKTKSQLIRRESGFEKGAFLTEDSMRFAQTSLLALGLFSRVFIKPVKVGSQVDLFIDVHEKDFGVLELAPGYRTDLGYKLSSKLSYSNLEGMNKQVNLNAIVNQRDNLDALEEQRQDQKINLLEYQVLLNYTENKIFYDHLPLELDWSTSFSTSRRRFYSFDADIERLNNIFSSKVNEQVSVSLTHQLEIISQFNSTLAREHGHFKIGALTPGITLDFRDNRINPLKGSYFNLTYEVANEAFGSQTTDDLVVNYYKVVSRNKFYLPMGDVTMAISLAAGVQKNLATGIVTDSNGNQTTEGYIPNIKVFRLTGVDLVRGFADGEINRLVSGNDISEVRVDDTAYMASLKIEPRVFLSDQTMLGVFYDAGRVFVDSYDFSELRSSAGLTFKVLTPVGSLDFDYGIKLLRKRDSDGKLESPGRLHVSIGFF